MKILVRWRAGPSKSSSGIGHTSSAVSAAGARTPWLVSVPESVAQCGLLQFPRLSPAIIVLVRRGERLLLARSRQTPPGMYSVLAGFVEPGETLEQAVEREVKEEVGISVSNIRYFGSQPWPFPHSLMIGFTAEHAEGELDIDRNEMEDAGWYSVDRLPMLPPPISIARRLIDDFLRACNGKPVRKDSD